MGKRKRIAQKESCLVLNHGCLYNVQPPDRPTISNNFVLRFSYTFISWCVIGFSMVPGRQLFTSIVLFTIPLLFDWLRCVPSTKSRQFFRYFEIAVATLFIVFSVLGLMGVLCTQMVNDVVYLFTPSDFAIPSSKLFAIANVWYALLIPCFLTVADCFAYSRKTEVFSTAEVVQP